MNTKYGKLAGGVVEYAPPVLETALGVVAAPSEATYLAQGWKRIVDEPPTVPVGKRAAATGWTEDATTLTRVYETVEAARPPRTFSKYRLVAVLKEAGVWPVVKAWITDKGLYDLYAAAQDFAEDNPYFRQGLAELKTLTGKTDAQIEAFLARCVVA